MVFYHPKYYKELRKLRNKLDKATSYKLPGPRPISNANKGLLHKRQAASVKHQAPEDS